MSRQSLVSLFRVIDPVRSELRYLVELDSVAPVAGPEQGRFVHFDNDQVNAVGAFDIASKFDVAATRVQRLVM